MAAPLAVLIACEEPQADRDRAAREMIKILLISFLQTC
jgi:hypothetical protein